VSGLEIEILGDIPASFSATELRRWCEHALAQAGLTDGHVALTFVDERHIRDLNRRYRQLDEPTDVLSFGVDENRPAAGPRELGDIFICPAHSQDIREAVVHGALHLAGMDHEADGGEMLALQDQILQKR
jgi:probable rRNA maturation factor